MLLLSLLLAAAKIDMPSSLFGETTLALRPHLGLLQLVLSSDSRGVPAPVEQVKCFPLMDPAMKDKGT